MAILILHTLYLNRDIKLWRNGDHHVVEGKLDVQDAADETRTLNNRLSIVPANKK